tara:strand:+ start:934 stop:1161 length:228 start_codon:yes stop_codon:yes gene_type:complete
VGSIKEINLREFFGIVEVTKEAYLDKTDKIGLFVAITKQFKKKLRKPVTFEIETKEKVDVNIDHFHNARNFSFIK